MQRITDDSPRGYAVGLLRTTPTSRFSAPEHDASAMKTVTRLEISPLLLVASVATAAFPPGCGDTVGVTVTVTDTTSGTDSSTGGPTTQGTTTTPTTDPSTTEAPTTGAPTTSTSTSTSTTDLSTTDPSTTDLSTGTTTDLSTGTDTGTSDSTDTGSSTGDGVCGDGTIDGSEECDDGPDNADTAACTSACLNNICGDGLVLAGTEACDDGGESDACNADCTVASCGDGVVNMIAGETCDAGGESAACDLDCTPAQCTDGVKNTAAGEACDDGNMVDDDACSNLCEFGEIVLGGNDFTTMPSAMDATGAPYTLQPVKWIPPDSAGLIILSHNGGSGAGPDYAPHFAAGRHLLVLGGSGHMDYWSFITEHFTATVDPEWHETSDCDPDWTRGAAHPITALMPANHEFIDPSITDHMVHFSGTDQPPGVTVLGKMCHPAPYDGILVTRKYPGGGTFTYMGFAVNVFADATSQAEFLVPFLDGYLDWIGQGAP